MGFCVGFGGLCCFHLLDHHNGILITHHFCLDIPRLNLLVVKIGLETFWESIAMGDDGKANTHLSSILQHIFSREVIVGGDVRMG